jgi:DNA-binding XRE family transcriptional regulator
VEGADEFAGWFEALTDDEQISVGRVVELLAEHGPSPPFPYSSGIATSRHRRMRELKIQHEGRPYRVRMRSTRDERQFFCWAGTNGKRSVVRGARSGRRQSVRRVPQGIAARGADMKRQKWSDIKARIKPATRARMEAEGRRLSDDLHLSQLRKARGLTQETMAELLGVSQAEVSKMERRTELYVGTLRKFIEAMNGELVLAARFPDGVEIPIQLAEAKNAV